MLDKPTISIVSLAAQDLSVPKRTPRSQATRQAGGQSSATFQALAQNSITNCEKENAISWLVNQFLLFSLPSSVPPVVAAAVAATKGATRRAQTVVPITDLCSPLVFQFFFSMLLSTVSEVNIIFLIEFQFSRFAINLAQVAN